MIQVEITVLNCKNNLLYNNYSNSVLGMKVLVVNEQTNKGKRRKIKKSQLTLKILHCVHDG